GSELNVDVTLKVSNNDIELTVADSGFGMPSDYSSETSMGLGMRISELLSEQMGGKFEPPVAGGKASFTVIAPRKMPDS
ncbi:MAG: ATP-binding protein, partial [Sphingorhabdus sp.]